MAFEELGIKDDDFDVQIPDKCADCGVQCELRKKAIALNKLKQMTEAAGSTLIVEAGEEFDSMVDAHFPEELADDFKLEARRAMSQGIERVDNQITSTQREIDAYALACTGVLKMRAARGDVRYTVSVCTSARAYVRDSETPMHMPIHIRAESTD